MATWYLDGTATGSGNGTSWANAFTTFAAVYASHNVAAGDLVYVSGGASGFTQTYITTSIVGFPGQWFWYNKGTVGSPITFQIGQHVLHNGVVFLDGQLSQGNNSGVMQDGNQSSPGNGPGWQNIIVSGNANNDGFCHIKFVNTGQVAAVSGSGWTNIRLTWLDFGQPLATANATCLQINPSNGGIEIDHCKGDMSLQTNCSSLIACLNSNASGAYGIDLIHDNNITVPRDPVFSNALGGKAVQWDGGSVDVYNNLFTCVACPGYNGGQHNDAFFNQSTTAPISFLRFFNNRTINFANYTGFFLGGTTGYNHVRIFNNTSSVDTAIGAGQQSIVVYANSSQGLVANDLQCVNNTMDNFSSPYNMRNSLIWPTSDPAAFTNCVFQNNVEINTGGTGDQVDAAFSIASNSVLLNAVGAANFLSYAGIGLAGNNYMLLSGSALRAAGNAAVAPSIDASGRGRAATPSRGAYEYYQTGVSAKAPGYTLVTAGP